MVAYPNIYDSIAELMAGMDPKKVLAFHAPQDIQLRIEFLLEKKQVEGSLSENETEEMEHYFILEHIVRLAKSRARLKLTQTQA